VKLKHKYRASLTILFLFFIHTASLMLFSYLVSNVFIPREFDDFLAQMSQITEDCPSVLYRYNCEQVLAEYSQKHNIQIQLIDQSNRQLFSTGGNPLKINKVTQVKAGTVDGWPVIIKLDFKLTNMWVPNWIKSFAVFFQITIVVVMYLVVAFVVHSQFVDPIVQLSRRMGIKETKQVKFWHFAGCNAELSYLVERYDELMGEINGEREKQNRIIASISHDIKSPLTSVMGYVERLRGGKADTIEKQRHYLDIIYRKAESIKNLVDEFDDYLSATTTVMHMKKQNVKLLPFLVSLYEDYRAEFEAINASIAFTTGPIDENTTIYADINRLHRVFGNIIGNSVKHSGGRLSVSISAKVKDGFAVISVSDNGGGVDEQDIDKIFDPLYMADKARQSGREGSGLGLSICKSIVEAHGGVIAARNIAPHGFQVEISIPVAAA